MRREWTLCSLSLGRVAFKAAPSRLLILNLARRALATLCLNLDFKKFLKFFKNLRHAEFTDRLFKFKIRAIFDRRCG